MKNQIISRSKTISVSVVLVAASLALATVAAMMAVQDALAIGDLNLRNAKQFTPGQANGFDPKPEPPGKENFARSLALGHTEIGDPQITEPVNVIPDNDVQ
jgi:hypothetical protein